MRPRRRRVLGIACCASRSHARAHTRTRLDHRPRVSESLVGHQPPVNITMTTLASSSTGAPNTNCKHIHRSSRIVARGLLGSAAGVQGKTGTSRPCDRPPRRRGSHRPRRPAARRSMPPPSRPQASPRRTSPVGVRTAGAAPSGRAPCARWPSPIAQVNERVRRGARSSCPSVDTCAAAGQVNGRRLERWRGDYGPIIARTDSSCRLRPTVRARVARPSSKRAAGRPDS